MDGTLDWPRTSQELNLSSSSSCSTVVVVVIVLVVVVYVGRAVVSTGSIH